MPEDWALKDFGEGHRVDAGDGDVGAEPVDHQRRQREPDPLLEFLGLGERAEIEIGGKLLGGGNHCSLSLGPPVGPRSEPRAPALVCPSDCHQHGTVTQRAQAPQRHFRMRPTRPPAPRAGPAGGVPDRRYSSLAAAFGLPVLAFLAADFLRLASSAGSTFLLDQRDRAAGALDRRLGARRGVIDRQRQLGLQLAVAQHAHAVERAADDARRHQRRHVNRLGRIEQAGVHGRLQAAER